jgi:penicillin G amidase
MSKNRRLLRRAAFLAAGLTGSTYAARRFLRRSLPQSRGELRLPGLQHNVEIIRDRWGVPHIYAANESDLFFAQGFVQAQDRLFQMDLNRRAGAGRLSEVVGPLGLAIDRLARRAGWPRAAARQVGADSRSEAVATAYAAGVNAFIKQGTLPLEFSLLFYRPQPWRPLDSALWGVVVGWGLSSNFEAELLRTALLEQVGPEKAASFDPEYGREYQTVLPARQIGARAAANLVKAYRRALEELLLKELPLGPGAGSNNWVVNGRHTLSGRPILANDPHLPAGFPAFWYEIHLQGGDYNVAGFALPGIPGVIIGHNDKIAWGFTNAFPDVQDLYLERFHPQDALRYEVDGRWQQAQVVTERIRVRGRRPVQEKVVYTHHGPLISGLVAGETRPLALRWSGYEAGNHLRCVLGMNRAASWDDFREALRHWRFPSQNVVYADVEGNVGYMMPGRVPRRGKGDGLLPAPGWDSNYDWQGWIPFEELPAVYNPAEGMIATANNRVAGDDYPHHLTVEWLPSYRAQRIYQLLRDLAPLTVEKNGRIQNDTVSLMARRFLSRALAVLGDGSRVGSGNDVEDRAFRLLRQWDHDMRPNLAAPTIYFAWHTCLAHLVLNGAIGALANKFLTKEGPPEFAGAPLYDVGLELVASWLESGAPAWVGDIRPLLFRAYRQAIADLQRRLGPEPVNWQWGRVHRVHFHHPLARIPGLGRVWKPQTLSLGGDGFTVNQAESKPSFPPEPVHIIASGRLILDVGDWDNSRAALPGGQSAHPASPHYQDALQEWHDGRYHPMLFSRRAVEAATEDKLFLLPGG